MAGTDPTRTRRLPPLLIAAFVVHALLVVFVLHNDVISHQDENYYFSTTRTMMATSDYLVPEYDGKPRIKKPILFYWLMLPTQAVFGQGFWTGRLISLISSLALLAVTWKISAFTFTDQARRIATVWMIASADIFFRYSHYAVPEMTLTLALALAHWAFVAGDRRGFQGPGGRRALLAFYAAMGTAFMIKGPVGILLPLLTAIATYVVQRRPREILRIIWIPGIVLMVAMNAPWYLLVFQRYGMERVAEMIRIETAQRMGIDLSTALFYIPITLTYYLPWTVFLLGRLPRPSTWARDKAALGGVLRSYNFVWFATYFVFYSVVVSENRQWYALQWAIPWVIMLAQAIDLPDFSRARENLLRGLGVASIVFAGLVAFVFWRLGPLMGSPTGVAMLAAYFIIAATVFLTLSRRATPALIRIAALACLFMVAHTVFFQAVLPTTTLRPAMAFGQYLQQQEGPFELLVSDRYFNKKLPRYDIPGLEKTEFQAKPSRFRAAWRNNRPDFVICFQRHMPDGPPHDDYPVVIEGYGKSLDTPTLSDWIAMFRTGDPEFVFDRAMLLRCADRLSTILDR